MARKNGGGSLPTGAGSSKGQPGRDIVVIGASAGGVQPILDLAKGLPPDLPASLFVAIHTSPDSYGFLPQLMGNATRLKCKYAEEGDQIRRGTIFIAPPDHHLILEHGFVQLSRGPKENGFRPAVDPLFRTAASVYGSRVVGILLSGDLDDGTQGMIAIKERGGATMVQNPSEAMFPSMPIEAIERDHVDVILRVWEMPSFLDRMARTPPGKAVQVPTRKNGDDVARYGEEVKATGMRERSPSSLTCPECGGALWEEGDMDYRCHVGHAYTARSLDIEQKRAHEAAMWTAVRTLKDNAELCRRMAAESRRGRLEGLAKVYEKRSVEADKNAAAIQDVIVGRRRPPETLRRPRGARRRKTRSEAS
jgi:two-component system, chemotaxis family, protein-glutamate methylesterase/glutaminase